MAADCICSVLSSVVCDKVARDTDVRQLSAGTIRRSIPQLMNRNHCAREKAVMAEPAVLQSRAVAGIEQHRAVPAVPAAQTLH